MFLQKGRHSFRKFLVSLLLRNILVYQMVELGAGLPEHTALLS